MDAPGQVVEHQGVAKQNTPRENPLGHLILVHLVLPTRPAVENQDIHARIRICGQDGDRKEKLEPLPDVCEHGGESGVVECLHLDDIECRGIDVLKLFLCVERHALPN